MSDFTPPRLPWQRRKNTPAPLAERILRNSEVAPEGCRVWLSARTGGYGRIKVDGECRYAHRVAWELERGPIPAGTQLDHLCRNRACVLVAHLEVVTPAINTRRGMGNGSKAACPSGHLYTAENTYRTRQGRRKCRACSRRHVCESMRRAREREAAQGG